MEDYSYGNYYAEDPETLRRNFFIRGDCVNIRLRRRIGHIKRLQALSVTTVRQNPAELGPQLLQAYDKWTNELDLSDSTVLVRQYKKFIFEVVLPRIMIKLAQSQNESANTQLY